MGSEMCIRDRFITADTSDLFAHHGRSAAETGYDIETPTDRQVTAGTGAGKADLELATLVDVLGAPLFNRLVIQLAGGLRAGNDETCIEVRFEYEASKTDLDAGGVGIVSEHAIGPVKRDAVERPTGRQSQVMSAVSTAVVQQAE